MTGQPRNPRWAAAAVIGALVALIGVVSTSASWVDREWVAGVAGTLDCTDPDRALSSRGQGRVLSGSLLGLDLDALAEVSGVEVVHDGAGPAVEPSTATPVPGQPEAYANPLDVTALGAINLAAEGGLILDVDTPVAALGQYARARGDGTAAGASGYLTDSGGIDLGPADGYPDLATLDLSKLLGSLDPALGGSLSALGNVSAEVGAVAGRAHIDGCDLMWSDPGALVREYLVSSLDLVIDAPTVAALADMVRGVVAELEETVNGLGDPESEHSVLGALTSAVSGLVNGVAGNGTLNLAKTQITLGATVDLDAFEGLLTTPFASEDSVVTIDLAEGQVRVDTAALLAAAYPAAGSDQLNGLDPNTNLLADERVLNNLTTSVGKAVRDLVGVVTDLLTATIDGVEVDLKVVLTLQVSALGLLNIDIGTVTVSVKASLLSLLNDTPEVSTASDLVALGLLNPLSPIVNALVSTLLMSLSSSLAPTVGGVIDGALGGLRTLPVAAGEIAAPIVGAVSELYTGMFLDGVVAITINAQNRPAANVNPVPPDWSEFADGRYEVAALRVGVLDVAREEGVRLYLGRASVGPVRLAPR